MKKLLSLVLAALMLLSLCSFSLVEEKTTYTVGICNYVDDASLNQIVSNLEARLEEIGAEQGVTFEIVYDNCMADSVVLAQIIADFTGRNVDLMVGVATPVALAMQGAADETGIPVVFAAVSDPVAAGLVESMEAPAGGLTGTSDYLDTHAVMNLMFALNPDITKVGLLYDMGQDSSTTAIAAAKAYLEARGVEVVERTGTTTAEVLLAAQSLVTAGVQAVFTPSDNTIMTAELTICDTFMDAGIPHYCGADSFALNGAFLGFGVDYANLGRETGDMVADILLNGRKPAEVPVRTFDNGTATVNTEVCEALGITFEDAAAAFEPYCTKVVSIVTADEFSDLQ